MRIDIGNIGLTALRKPLVEDRVRRVQWIGLTCLIAASLICTAPAKASLMTFDFFFNGKSQSGSGMLEATENKDGSFTAVKGFVRTFNNDSVKPLWEFEEIYEKMTAEAIEKLEKISMEDVKGSEYYNLFVNPKGSEASYSPSGYFIYDNLLHPSVLDQLLGNPGLLFMTEKGKELNLFTNGPSNYIDYQNNGFNIQTSFHLIQTSNYLPSTPLPELPDSSAINAVPEPSVLALLILGFTGFCLARRKSIGLTKPSVEMG